MGPFLPWALAIGVIVVRDVRTVGRPPVPAEFVASGAAFGMFALIGQANEGLGSALAWGLLTAIVLQKGPAALVGGQTASPTPGSTTGSGAGSNLRKRTTKKKGR